MKLAFPSREFDDAVAAVCHGSVSEEQAREMNELLRVNCGARDEYILRVELHSRLASEPDLFASALGGIHEPLSSSEGARASARFNVPQGEGRENSSMLPVGELKRRERRAPVARIVAYSIALAACVALLAAGVWVLQVSRQNDRHGATSKAVAMLNRVVDAQWSPREKTPRLGAPLEPGWLRLDSGLAQIVFYSGARVVIEGPAALQIISPGEAVCRPAPEISATPCPNRAAIP